MLTRKGREPTLVALVSLVARESPEAPNGSDRERDDAEVHAPGERADLQPESRLAPMSTAQ